MWGKKTVIRLFVCILLQQSVEGMYRCCSLYCALSAGSLSCYYTPEEITAKVEPSLRIPIHKVNHAMEPCRAEHKYCFCRTNRTVTYLLLTRYCLVSSLLSFQDTRITVVDRDPGSGRRSHSLTILNPAPGGSQAHVFSTDTRQELEDWLEAFWQHFYDQSECSQM